MGTQGTLRDQTIRHMAPNHVDDLVHAVNKKMQNKTQENLAEVADIASKIQPFKNGIDSLNHLRKKIQLRYTPESSGITSNQLDTGRDSKEQIQDEPFEGKLDTFKYLEDDKTLSDNLSNDSVQED